MQQAALGELERAGLFGSATFRVRARRSHKGFPLTSPEINREVGAFVQERTGAAVDLSAAADHTVGIEVQRERALVYARVLRGPGGLPIPVSGRVVALMSAGLDSPVAAWMMMKRGCAVIPLHFAGDEGNRQRFLEICKRLQDWSHGWELRPVVLSHQEALAGIGQRLRARRAERWTCLFCKRAMVAEAERVAEKHRAQAVVLGDSLGQVASQTLDNMRVISSGSSLPIFRPLIGLDKTEIAEIARRIGTYEVSAQAQPPCPYLPGRPITQASYAKFLSLAALIEEEDREGQAG